MAATGQAGGAADVYCARLGDSSFDAKLKLQVASELRDSIDLFTHTQPEEYDKFLKTSIPVFLEILRGPPVFLSTSPEQKLRNMILDIIHRLPFNPPEALEPWASDITKLLTDLIKTENEENAVLCMKTIMDFQRTYQKQLVDEVQPFLNLILEMFKMMPKAVKETFDDPASVTGNTPGMPGTPANAQNYNSPKPMSPMVPGNDPATEAPQPAKMLTKGMQSFKVLAECPIIVVSLFQVHKQSVHKNVKLFVPLIREMLQLQAGPQEQEHIAAKERGESFTGVSRRIKNRAAFGEFIIAQVKTMSFLAYVLRVYAQQLTDFLPHLPEIVVRLLKDCPRERSGARKELLVATRHIINFNFRRIFLSKIDELLDENVLIGDGLTVYETMRPLAYSMLADLIHHVREVLNPEQIRRTIEVYTKNLHDNFPGTSFQTMSAKLLLNLAECIAKLPNKQEARHFLIMILDAIAEKFAAMNRQYPNACKQTRLYRLPKDELEKVDEDTSEPSKDEYDEIDIFSASPIRTTNPRERGADPVLDNKFLFKNLMNGLKTMLFGLRNCNPEVPAGEQTSMLAPNWSEVAYGFTSEEVKIIIKLFHEGARVFKYFGDIDNEEKLPTEMLFMIPQGKEEKELLETFATVFHCIDPATFHEVFHTEIPHLFNMMFEHCSLLHVSQFFLASEATSPIFCGMLLQFLMEHLHEVGVTHPKRSQILLRLFKLSFMAVTLFSQSNESVLYPHVKKIIIESLNLATTAEEPLNYFYLFRSLFRSIGGGRFEHLYKEILPLLEVLLENLNTQLNSTRKPHERDLYVELCLTVPARLSNLLPHLSHLMRPLVISLRGSKDLVAKGLKTLELCVDNLTPDYLDPIMAPYIDDLMAALWEHLKPQPYDHQPAHTAMRILGKLGGRNRKFLTNPPPLDYQGYAGDEPSIDITLWGAPGERAMPILQSVDLALSRIIDLRPPKNDIEKKTDAFYKKEALQYLSSTLKLFIGFDQLPDDFAELVRLHANDLAQPTTDFTPVGHMSDRRKAISKKNEQEDVLRKLLIACFHATAIEELSDEATAFILDVCKHFTIMEFGVGLVEIRSRRQPFAVNGGEGLMALDTRVLALAIGDCLSSETKSVRDATVNALKVMHETAAVIFGSADKVPRLPFFLNLSKVFCHNCFEEEWYPKFGGVLGILTMAEDVDMGLPWLKERQNEFIRALLFVIKDMPPELPAQTRALAQETIEIVLRKCNKGVTKEELTQPGKGLQLCSLLIAELCNQNKNVRETVQKCFASLEEIVGVSRHQLMTPAKDRLLQPIFNKPLRALPFATQIGYIDAITYCFKLEPSFLEFSEELNRLLMEALALADADDEALSNNKMIEYRTSDQILNLRVVCIKLLSSVILSSEFSQPDKSHTRGRIISVFFKSLYYKSPEVIEAANAGLKGVLQQTNKLPRDLLQSGLRPILMNLSDPKRLNVGGLEGLARLLELLTNYFKVEIGARLLDHMRILTEQNSMQKSFLLEQNREIRIMEAILNIFHLLPPAAISFLGGLFDVVVELEKKLRRTQHSPVRSPLIKYLNRYSKETWDHIRGSKMDNLEYGRLFGQLLEDEACDKVREVVQEDIPSLLAASIQHKYEDPATPEKELGKYVRNYNAINIVAAISKYASKDWFAANSELISKLLDAGVSMRAEGREEKIPVIMKLPVEQACVTMLDVCMRYLRNIDDYDFLFKVIDITTVDKRGKIHNILTHHIYKHIICKGSIEQWKAISHKCLDLYTRDNSAQDTKTFAFKYLLNPILAMDKKRGSPLENGHRLVDRAFIDAVHNKIWRPNLGDLGDDYTSPGLDHSRMELLQMSSLLVRDHTQTLQDARKDVIKFGWNYIKLEDIINKQAAYCLIAFFIKNYDTPSKIVIQIYVALLKAHQHEARPLVTQALELIAPVLKKRVPGASDPKYPIWARWPRRILSEEGHSQSQMTNIFHFLVRHDDLFFDSREHFSVWIVTALPKLVFQIPNPSAEYKRLFLRLIELIWKWEARRVELSKTTSQSPEASPSRKRKHGMVEGQSPAPSVQSNNSVGETMSTPYRLLVIKHLVTFTCRLTEPFPDDEHCKLALDLLKNFLNQEYWGDLEIDLFPKAMDEHLCPQDVEEKLCGVINGLQVLNVILSLRTDAFIMQQLPYLQKILEKSLRSDNPRVQESLQPVLARVIEAIPVEKQEGNGEDEMMIDDEQPATESPATQFLSMISSIVNENLNGNLMSSVHILHTMAEKRPTAIDDHIISLMKAFQKLGKDHLTTPINPQPQMPGLPPNVPRPDGAAGAANGAGPTFDTDTTTSLLCKVIDVCAARVSALADQRRPFLSVMAQLVDKSQSSKLCLKILGIVNRWVFGAHETFPTLKEKSAVLQKMLVFETRSDPELCNAFLNLVIDIYSDQRNCNTELTVRLEHAFLVGTRAKDVNMRNRFLTIFDKSISRSVSSRFGFLIGTQSWETLRESYWINQVEHLLLGSVDMEEKAEMHVDDLRVLKASTLFAIYGANDKRTPDVMVDEKLEDLINSHRKFIRSLGEVKAGDLLEPIRQLQHLDPKISHKIWKYLFPLCWSAIGRDDRLDISRQMVQLLAKPWHDSQTEKRPNIVQSLLEGVENANPRLSLPTHLVKHMGQSYDGHYTALSLLEHAVNEPPVDSAHVRDSNLDALTEMYAKLGEDDLFYGLWRRRAQYVETNAALSFEQHGMWERAQHMYETAQIKTRTNALPFSTPEYMLWEDHWVECAQKLQQWEILHELGRHENYNELTLECGWRLNDAWKGEELANMDRSLKALMDQPTPRRYFFSAFIALQKFYQKIEPGQDYNRIVDEAIQMSLRKWHGLPKRVTNAHIPLLQTFQSLVELHDASLIYNSLASTTRENLDAKSQELKLTLASWRDRLPNVWDDINAWHDLVTWRQHIFTSINHTYLPLIPNQQNGGSSANSYAYRGYHETAWIINRFAHVARKHNLPDVCINQLSKIYTLPNIEIQEAFLKLREQAKCHYQNRNELHQGLEVINNTNLGYFASQQKAEFYTLKGMFLSKLSEKNESNEAFTLALYHDLKLPKAWAQWGRYNDENFKNNPTDMQAGGNAVNCYLEAAGLYKNGKARKLLGRVLWLLGLDDANQTITYAFDEYKGEIPVWYWITYIPQLLTSLSHKEARIARGLLIKIAKNYPQALYFLLRTTREDLQLIRKQQQAQLAARGGKAGSPATGQRTGSVQPNGTPGAHGTSASPQMANSQPPQAAAGSPTLNTAQPSANGSPAPQGGQQPNGQIVKRAPWDYAEEIMTVLKTAFPLLALSMETMGDQISKFFKCPPDEDAYRLIVALLNDSIQWTARMHPMLEGTRLPPSTEANINRFAETIQQPTIRKAFEADFVSEKPNLKDYVERLRRWRDRFEEKLDRRPLQMNLENYSPHLSEFKYQRFDDVEVPGQYLLHKDNNKDFVRIDRFLPKVDVVRGYGICHRRLRMRGHDGSTHAFAIQHPAARNCRREERILQLFRIFNGILSRRKESRRRNIQFHLPVMVPLAPQIRLVQDDSSYISLQAVYEDHCRQLGFAKDEPIMYSIESCINAVDSKQQVIDPGVRVEIFNSIQNRYVPHTAVLDFFSKAYPAFADFFLFRRQFSYQFAALTFMTYIMSMSGRYPHKMFISRSSGNVWGSELMPGLAATSSAFHNNEMVPFRFTPNIQTLMGPIAGEGIFAAAIMVIARCLAEPDVLNNSEEAKRRAMQSVQKEGGAPPNSGAEGKPIQNDAQYDLEQHLSVFVRDEMTFWYTQQHRSGISEQQLRDQVLKNSELIISKATSLAQTGASTLPANQTVIDLIAKATNPLYLAQLDHLWMPYV